MADDTLVAALHDWAAADGAALHYHILHDDDSEETYSVAQTRDQMDEWAARLAEAGVASSEILLIILPHGAALYMAMWGALRLGAPLCFYPTPNRRGALSLYAAMLRQLIHSAGIRHILTTHEFSENLSDVFVGDELNIIDADEIGTRMPSQSVDGWMMPSADSAAMLMLTSGTGGSQKAIMHTHGNIIQQTRAAGDNINLRETERFITWMPLYHEFGLISAVFSPLLYRFPSYVMSAANWVKRPSTLFRAIDRFRATRCYMPNFALAHCTRGIRTADIDGVDLSSWYVLLISSEPIRLETMTNFNARFVAYNFDPEAFGTAYGMTESCGAATLRGRGAIRGVRWIDELTLEREQVAIEVQPNATGALAMVSCGPAVGGVVVAALADDDSVQRDRVVGEIGMKGDAIMQRYYRRPDLNSSLYRSGWFATGDLGFMIAGDLYVCGRRKDLIVHAGRNIHPETLEDIIATAPGARAGRVVAFGIPDARAGTEVVVAVIEIGREVADDQVLNVVAGIRAAVHDALDVSIADVRLVRESGWITKTTSGKIARSACRARYLNERAVIA